MSTFGSVDMACVTDRTKCCSDDENCCCVKERKQMQKPVILWGGTDINSNLYKQKPSKYAQHPDNQRDNYELLQIEYAKEKGLPVLGVCRGAQLLCVYNGGSLLQHTQPTRQNHAITTTDRFKFSSVVASHHQIMVPKGTHEVLAWNPEPVKVWGQDDETTWEETCTPEVVWFPEHLHLAIQPHPEWCLKGDPWLVYINALLKEKEIDYEF